MGNSSSQWNHHQQQQPQQHQRQFGRQQSWANSYPREGRGRPPQHLLGPGVAKVLPDREPGRRLRLTDNGAILSGGGTISGRKEQHADDHPRLEFRARSTSVHATPTQQQQHQQQQQQQEQQLMRFGSEPDLRARDAAPARSKLNNRSRKKYKAPAPPPTSPGGAEAASSSPDSGRWEEPRRIRLFKTRAETRRSGPPQGGTSSNQRPQPQPQHPPLVRSLSSPEFQAELVRAAQRLRPLSASPSAGLPTTAAQSRQRQPPLGDDTPRPPDKHWEILPPPRKRSAERRRQEPPKMFYFGMEQQASSGDKDVVDRFAASLQARRAPAPAQAAASNRVVRAGGSVSSGEASSSLSEEDDGLGGDISLQLRPTLPKKQLDIPRFSPTAAWRLLSAIDHPANSSPATSTAGDDASVLLEERIQRLSRPVAPPLPQAPRSKSGDSGISGDASPGHDEPAPRLKAAAWTPQQDLDESSSDGGDCPATTSSRRHRGQAEAAAPGAAGVATRGARFSPRPHVFSLSLPRDDRLCLALYAQQGDDFAATKSRLRRETSLEDAGAPFHSLQKLRRSVSGALGAALGTLARDGDDDEEVDRGRAPLDENWMLSRSVPGSLNAPAPAAGYSWSRGSPSSAERDSGGPQTPPGASPFSYLASGRHVMYLPGDDVDGSTPRPPARDRARSARGLWAAAPLSKSCGDISSCSEMRQVGRTPSPELPPDIRRDRDRDRERERERERERHREKQVASQQQQQQQQQQSADGEVGRRSKGRRFTFQSTVRQIERRRLAERLSREAELKERQRLSELEAMRQVEEEFQRKRAREKASIRQQLRLFSLDEQLYSSLPAGWGGAAPRADPDGADSPQPSPPPATANTTSSTQVLSEYREPRREYRDYTPSSRYIDSAHESLPYMEKKRATVHPQVVYDIPKNTQVYVAPHHQLNGLSGTSGYQSEDRAGVSTPHSSSSDNYRRDFAHGARPAVCSLASSDSESNMRPRSRLVNHSRSRSSSPEPCSSVRKSEEMNAKVGEKEMELQHTQSEQEPTSLPPIPISPSTQTENAHRLSFTSLQPFVRNSKGYRPIVFNPGNSASHKVAQTVS